MRKYITIFIGLLFVIAAWAVWVPAKVNLPHSLVRLLMSEDHTDVGSRTFSSGKKIRLPLDNDATKPTICFDDGTDCNDGIYMSANGVIRFAINGVRAFTVTGSIIGANDLHGGAIVNETPSSTNPVVVVSRNDLNIGLGRAAADQLSAIANSLEMTRWDGTVSSGASVWTDGGIVIGDISGATVSPITGVTSFIIILSGVSPVEGSGTPVSSVQLYVTGDEFFVADGNGTHTGLGSFDRVSGQATSKKWNVYTGKIVTRNWETGEVIVDSGTTHDWKADQLAYQKKSFINGYIQQTIEVPEGQATSFPDVEVDDIGGVTEYRFVVGRIFKGKKIESKKIVFFKKNKKIVKGKFKTVKPNHWMDGKGKFWRKKTRSEAQLAFVEDITPIGIKWDNLAPFLKAEIADPRL